MKTLSVFLLFLLAAALSAAEGELSFDRKVKQGDYFQAEITLNAEREYKFILSGPGKPVLKQDSLVLTLFGGMKVLEVNQYGNPSLIELRIDNISGTLNGTNLDSADLNGKVITGDLRKYPVRFLFSDTGKPIPRKAQLALSSLFRVPAENSLKDTLGTGMIPQNGKRWKISALPILESLKKRGFQITGDSILADAVFEGRERYRKTDCWKVVVNITSREMQTLDFRLKAELWIPVDPDKNVIRMIRTGTEVIDRPLPPENPISAGSEVRVITKERLEAVLIPAKEPPRTIPKNKEWSDFLLR